MAIADIAPGSRVNVKIVQEPTNAAGRKTLERLLSKSPAAQKEARRQEKVRRAGFRTKQRGGREDWAFRVPRQSPVDLKVGEAGTITASIDVLKDLRSIERFVEVTPA